MFFKRKKQRKLSERDLIAWQNALMETPSDRLSLTEEYMRKLTAMQLSTAVTQVIESVELVYNSKNQDTVLGRVALIKERAAYIDKIRPFVEIPPEYPESEVRAIIERYPDVLPLKQGRRG